VKALAGALVVLAAGAASAYPLYGSDASGIRRLEAARLAHQGAIPGRMKVKGELLPLEQVDLRLLERPDLRLPEPDRGFTRQIVALLGDKADRYQVAVLDLSDPDRPRYAEYRGNVRANPGSVGKLAVALALFQALADAYPNDRAARLRVLRHTVITADAFIHRDHHPVRLWDPRTRVLTRRPLVIGDRGTLYEFLDWMLSASSNAAAATVMKHAMLLRRFGTDYPLPAAAGRRFFDETPHQALKALFQQTFVAPLRPNGIDPNRFRQGSFFTRTGKRKVPGTTSYATARELMKYLLRLEQGRIVDVFSSREIKRLLYMTERRIRYASSPALRHAAVYFKSGSLYACRPEPGFRCLKYHGNRKNLMNSVAIVESPAGHPRLYYFVTLTSNVLRRNSAVDHQTLATRIQRLIEAAHAHPERSARSGRYAGHLGGNDEPVQGPDHARHPLAAARVVGQRDGDVSVAARFDQGAVGVPPAPGPGLAVDAHAGQPGEAAHEFVVDARIAQHRLHPATQGRSDQAPGREQVIEARGLHGGRGVRQVVQRIALVGRALAIFLAHPQTAVDQRIVEAKALRLKDLEHPPAADPIEHPGGRPVRRNAHHPGQGFAGHAVEAHRAALDLHEGAEQDREFGQAGGVEHLVAIDLGEPRLTEVGEIGEHHRESFAGHGAFHTERLEGALETRLEPWIEALAQRRVPRAAIGVGRQQRRAEQQNDREQPDPPHGAPL